MEYLGEGDRSVDLEQLAAKIAEHASDAREIAMNSLEGTQQGHARGQAEGRVEGQLEMLLKQLRKKVVALTDEDVAKVEAADAETLDVYLGRVLTADTVAAVLGG